MIWSKIIENPIRHPPTENWWLRIGRADLLPETSLLRQSSDRWWESVRSREGGSLGHARVDDEDRVEAERTLEAPTTRNVHTDYDQWRGDSQNLEKVEPFQLLMLKLKTAKPSCSQVNNKDAVRMKRYKTILEKPVCSPTTEY